jgi:hypothetical protein
MGSILGGGHDDRRFLNQWAAIVLGMALIGLAALLFIVPRYHIQQQAISMSREAVVKANMRALQVSLEQNMAEDGRGYPVRLSRSGNGQNDPMLDYLIVSLRRIRNPFDRDVPAVAVAYRDPPFWGLYRPGQVVYVPLGVEAGSANGYAIYGMGAKGPMSTVLENRPENGRRTNELESNYEPR